MRDLESLTRWTWERNSRVKTVFFFASSHKTTYENNEYDSR